VRTASISRHLKDNKAGASEKANRNGWPAHHFAELRRTISQEHPATVEQMRER
jgi:hypothetical protein